MKEALFIAFFLLSQNSKGSPSDSDLISTTTRVGKLIEAHLHLNQSSDKRLIMLPEGIVLPDFQNLSPKALEAFLVNSADQSLSDDGKTVGTWTAVFNPNNESPSDSHATPSPTAIPQIEKTNENALKQAKDLLLQAKQEQKANTDPLLTDLMALRVQQAQTAVDALLREHPELNKSSDIESSLSQVSPHDYPLKVLGFFPPIQDWSNASAWMSNLPIPVKGVLTIESSSSDNNAGSSTEANDASESTKYNKIVIKSLRIDLKQVSVTRGDYDVLELSKVLSSLPAFKGKWLITDYLIACNLRATIEDATSANVGRLLASIQSERVQKLSFGSLIFSGEYQPQFAKGRFTPSLQGDVLQNSSIQIIGYLCQDLSPH